MEKNTNPFRIKIPENAINNGKTTKENEVDITENYYMFNNPEEIENFIENIEMYLMDLTYSFKEEMEKFYKIINRVANSEDIIQKDELIKKDFYNILKEMSYYKTLYNIVLHESKKFLIDVLFDFNPFDQKSNTMEEIITNEIVLGFIAKGNQTYAMEILDDLNNEALNKINKNSNVLGTIISFKYTKPDVE